MPPAHFWDDEEEIEVDRVFDGVRYTKARRARDDDFDRRRAEFLVPESRTHTSLHRTRSHGHAPVPNVTIYNSTETNPNIRSEQKNPTTTEARGRAPRRMPGEWGLEDELAELRLEVTKQNRSRSRSVHHHHDEIDTHAYDHLKLEQANQRLREAEEKMRLEHEQELLKRKMELKYMKDRAARDEEEARIKSDEERWKREYQYKQTLEERKRIEREEELRHKEDLLRKDWELKQEREERKRVERDEELKLKEQYLKREWELKHEREERKRKEKEEEEEAERKRIIEENIAKMERREKEREEERKRIVAENQAKMEKAAREAKEARQRAVDEYNKEKAEAEAKRKAEQERAVAEYEAKKASDAAKAKKQREELIMQLKIEEEQQKQKEKEEYERFKMKQEKMEREEKEKKEKQEKELEEAMRKRLAQFGFQDNQIQAMIKPEDAAKLQPGLAPSNPMRLAQQPTYIKVRREHVAVDTLLYYDIPYEIDAGNPDYLIILREMDSHETEVLFEHTRRLRARGSGGTRLLIEERRDHGRNDYAWVRRRAPSRSPSRRRSSPKRVGLRDMFL